MTCTTVEIRKQVLCLLLASRISLTPFDIGQADLSMEVPNMPNAFSKLAMGNISMQGGGFSSE